MKWGLGGTSALEMRLNDEYCGVALSDLVEPGSLAYAITALLCHISSKMIDVLLAS